eukprot:SAG11_NODE_15632_length_571_cov_1.086864_1_plen_22_part_01
MHRLRYVYAALTPGPTAELAVE